MNLHTNCSLSALAREGDYTNNNRSLSSLLEIEGCKRFKVVLITHNLTKSPWLLVKRYQREKLVNFLLADSLYEHVVE